MSFYLKDAHGNVVGTTNANGVQNSSYTYDAFGNNLSAPASTDTNPFRYCGAYYDNESGNIYLRARYYDTASGRFISEDPIKDGLNWYSYCGGNPVGFVDPSGLEYIVVSASEYDGLITRRYKYNFIEPAIKKVKDLKGLKDGQWITWIISKTGYSDEDLQNFNDIAYEMGVGIQFIDSAAQLQNYINSQDINTWQLSSSRTDDPIKKFVVFSHGVVGSIELGYKQSNPGILSLNYNWIQGICSEAFNNPNTAFYSCNTGTDRDTKWGNNFAQNWVDRVSGRTWASVGKTDYAGILGVRSEEEENLAKKYGFNTKGAHNFPTTSGQWVNYFRRQY